MPNRLNTAFAEIAVEDSGGDGPAVLMIHGNSASKAVFARQFESSLVARLRLIAFDLPGHGASSDAPDPARAYTIGGYAACAVAVLEALGVRRAALYGWSLGGHVAMEMIGRFGGACGLMVSGAPPVPASAEGFAAGFKPGPLTALTGARDWSDADAEAFARAGAEPFAPFMLADARRADGRARETMLADALSGGAGDQRRLVESAQLPVAIVNGADDAFVNIAYFDTLDVANLWGGRAFNLPGVGHAPFWQAPDAFNPIFERFVVETAVS